jgi:hypothetical protein
VHATLVLARELLQLILTPQATDILTALDAMHATGDALPFTAADTAADAEHEVAAAISTAVPDVAKVGGCVHTDQHWACFPAVAHRVQDCAVFATHLIQTILPSAGDGVTLLAGRGPCSLHALLQRAHSLLFLVLRSKEFVALGDATSGGTGDGGCGLTRDVFAAVHQLLYAEKCPRETAAPAEFEAVVTTLRDCCVAGPLGTYHTAEAFGTTLAGLAGGAATTMVGTAWASGSFTFGSGDASGAAVRACDDEWDICMLSTRLRHLAERGELERRCSVCQGVTAAGFVSGDPPSWKPYPLSAAWSHSCPCGGAWRLRCDPVEPAFMVTEKEPVLK